MPQNGTGNGAGRTLLLLAFALVPLAPRPSLAADEGLIERCWTPAALAGSNKEAKPVRSHARLDLDALRQEALLPATPLPPELRGSIRSVELPPGEKLITDGAIAGYDGRIVDLLRAQGAKATFFVSGKWIETHRERAEQLIADPNFEIANHGFRHRDFSRIPDRTLNDEIVLADAAYMRARKALLARQCASGVDAQAAAPERVSLLRFPFGTCNAKSLAAVADSGLLAIQWDIVTGDPDPHITAKGIARNILAHAHPGAIVVAHANGRGRRTAEALAIALPKLKEQGYSFVTVSELIKAGKPVIAASCYLDRPRGKARIARASKRRSHVWPILGR